MARYLIVLALIAVAYGQSNVTSLLDLNPCGSWKPLGVNSQPLDTLPYSALCYPSPDGTEVIMQVVSTSTAKPFTGLIATASQKSNDNRAFLFVGAFDAPLDGYTLVNCHDGSQSVVKNDFSEAFVFTQSWYLPANASSSFLEDIVCRFMIAETTDIYWNDVFVDAVTAVDSGIVIGGAANDQTTAASSSPTGSTPDTSNLVIGRESSAVQSPQMIANTSSTLITQMGGAGSEQPATVDVSNTTDTMVDVSNTTDAIIEDTNITETTTNVITTTDVMMTAINTTDAIIDVSNITETTTAGILNTTEDIVDAVNITEATVDFSSTTEAAIDVSNITETTTVGILNTTEAIVDAVNITEATVDFSNTTEAAIDVSNITETTTVGIMNITETTTDVLNTTDATINLSNTTETTFVVPNTTDPVDAGNTTDIPVGLNDVTTALADVTNTTDATVEFAEIAVESTNTTTASVQVTNTPDAIFVDTNTTATTIDVGFTTDVVADATNSNETTTATAANLSSNIDVKVETTTIVVTPAATTTAGSPSAANSTNAPTTIPTSTTQKQTVSPTSAFDPTTTTVRSSAQTTTSSGAPALENKDTQKMLFGEKTGYWCENSGTIFALAKDSQCSTYYVGNYSDSMDELKPLGRFVCAGGTKFSTDVCGCAWANEFTCPTGY